MEKVKKRIQYNQIYLVRYKYEPPRIKGGVKETKSSVSIEGWLAYRKDSGEKDSLGSIRKMPITSGVR